VPARLKPLIFDKEIVDWESDIYPTASIVMKNNRKTKASPIWSRWERKPYPNWANVDAAIAAATTDFTTGMATHLTRFTRYDVWMCVRTREVILFNGAAATPYDAVSRSFGDVPATAMVAGDKLVKVGSAFPEGSTAPAAHYVLEDEILFTAAEHSVTFQATNRILGTRFVVEPNKYESMKEQRRVEFTDMIKRSYFGGGMGNVQTASTEQTGVKGVIGHCDTWTYNFGGILTRPDFFGFVGDGPGRYIRGDIGIAMSSFGLGIVNNWLTDIARKDSASGVGESLGFNVDNLKLVAGRNAKLFYESWLDEDPTTQGWFFVFPINKRQGSAFIEVSGPEFDGRVQLNDDILKENSYKGKKGEWYTFYGWEHGPEIGYGFGYGIEG